MLRRGVEGLGFRESPREIESPNPSTGAPECARYLALAPLPITGARVPRKQESPDFASEVGWLPVPADSSTCMFVVQETVLRAAGVDDDRVIGHQPHPKGFFYFGASALAIAARSPFVATTFSVETAWPFVMVSVTPR